MVGKSSKVLIDETCNRPNEVVVSACHNTVELRILTKGIIAPAALKHKL
jgi:hypothetical protein